MDKKAKDCGGIKVPKMLKQSEVKKPAVKKGKKK